ncbi:MAG: A/G-specific adenine glycosylase [Bradymonadales bacterium]|nr:A/G-specific adenine glycosylase [Bradymonadales bacterium]
MPGGLAFVSGADRVPGSQEEEPIDRDRIDSFNHSLARWYEQNRRRLPWRETREPYPVWLSEVMLQQTRVETVLAYYPRFLSRFPTLEALAQAPLSEALKLWEGMGYYARCRNLHKAARLVMERHSGRFPWSFEEVVALPGIGRSTAGAILSFVHEQRLPVLDGNVQRVLIRLHRIEQDPGRAAVRARLWRLAQEMVDRSHSPGVFNQSMMELGALICTARAPRCSACPVSGHCQAWACGDPSGLPLVKRAKPLPHYDIGVGIIWHEGHVLIQLRPEKGLLGGLWEFPGGKREPGEEIPDTVRREIREELGIEIEVTAPAVVVRHAYSHFKVTLHAFHCHWLSGTPSPRAAQGWCWVKPERTEEYAFPQANRLILEHIRQEGRSGAG